MFRFIVRVFVLTLIVLALVALFAPAAFAAPAGETAAPTIVTPEQLGAFAGILLSLIFAYVPGAKTWYNAKTGEQRALIMLGLLLLVTLGIFGLSCVAPTYLPFAVACTQAGAWELLFVFVAALVANQGTFLVAVDPFKPKQPIQASA